MENNSKYSFSAGYLTGKEIVKQRSCRKYLIHKRAKLRSKVTDKLFFYKKWLSLIKSRRGDVDTDALSEIFETEFKAEWFDVPQGFETSREKEFLMAERFLNAFKEKKFQILGTDVPCEIKSSKPFLWQDVSFDTIRDTCDFIAKDGEGRIHLIKVVHSMDYSMRARTAVNKPINCPELVIMKAAFINEYPDAVCEMWSVKSKDDTGLFVSDSFKKNIVSCSFEGFETKEALTLFLYDVMALEPECSNCDSCIYREICQISDVRKDNVEEEVKAQVKAMNFTSEQEELIEHVDGPMSVIAIPGAGKTAALVERCKRLIEKGVDARNILLLSFTKKAVEELRERLHLHLGKNIPKVLTLNSFGSDILSNNWGMVGSRLKLASDTDCMGLIEELMPTQNNISGVSYDGIATKFGLVPTLYSYFKEIKEFGESAFIEKYAEKKDVENILSFYNAYEAEYASRHLMSYDDQISMALNLLKGNEKLARMMSKIYRYIMVDEYQDVNSEQAELIDVIAKHHNNIVVVGDDDQSIYGWRGGSNRFLIDFPERYPAARTVVFCNNFRSTDKILTACQTLINKNNGSRIEKMFIPHRNGTNAPCLFKNFTPEAVPGVIIRANKAGFKNGEIAVICRKNKVVELVSRALEKQGIKSISPRDFLIDDPIWNGIRDVLSIASSEEEKVDDFRLYRLLRILGVGPRSMVKIDTYKDCSLYEQLVGAHYMKSLFDGSYEGYAEEIPDPESIGDMLMVPVLNAGHKIYLAIKEVKASRRMSEVIPKISNILFGVSKHPAITALLEQADERGIADTFKLLTFMESCKRYSSTDGVDYATSDECVNVMTAHASKGKEFSFVLVFGVEEFDEDEESTRLLFVAMSRAKKSLFLTEGPSGYSVLVPALKKDVQVRAY